MSPRTCKQVQTSIRPTRGNKDEDWAAQYVDNRAGKWKWAGGICADDESLMEPTYFAVMQHFRCPPAAEALEGGPIYHQADGIGGERNG